MKGAIVWLTGLSGAGKSTLANAIIRELAPQRPCELLDGDEMREYLTKGLGFSREDRDTNVNRIAYVGRLLAKHGVLVFVAAIAPYRATRESLAALSRTAGHELVEVYVNAPLATVEQPHVKGPYPKARAGEIAHFTGISDPYEAPTAPAVEVRTDRESLAESAQKIIAALTAKNLV